jgi:hypothetical protein
LAAIERNTQSDSFRGGGLPLVHLGDQLADAVDEDVLVVDRRQALDAGHYFQPAVAVLIAPDVGVRLFGEREEGVLHRRHVVFQHRVGHVADEQIVLLVAVRQQVGVVFQSIRIHASLIGVLETNVKYRGNRNRRKVSGY